LLDAAALSVREALRLGTRALRDAGSDTPRLDAELLLAFAVGVDRARLLIEDVSVPAAFDELLARRAGREPVAYITGVKEFRRLSLTVDPRVLIPRPETELLVEVGLSLPSGARVADVGTGSGAVALALKDERPDLVVTATDLFSDALCVARENALRLGLEVRFVEADLLDDAPYDAVLANLPYVPAGARDLSPEIVGFEPSEALFAGADGLDVIRRLIALLGRVPFVALEVGLGQASEVAQLLDEAGFGSAQTVRDLAGIERVVVGRR
jgi:release factor glutamine methyltransferase